MLISTRTTNVLLILVLAVGIGIAAMLATGVRGGPLDPPGAPAPTMKTLQEVEPRSPITQPADSSGFPIQINTPGSYYLTGNITGVAGKDGISINANDVTLDLNGFTVSGNGQVGLRGITDNLLSRTGVTIRNGVVLDWDFGLYTSKVTRSTYEDLTTTHNNVGMRIGSGSHIRRVIVTSNSQGLVIEEAPTPGGEACGLCDLGEGTIVEDASFTSNDFRGVQINASNVWLHDNVVEDNGSDGIRVAPNTAVRAQITDNRIVGNRGFGVELGGNFNVVMRNIIFANTSGPVDQSLSIINFVGPLQVSPSFDPNANIGDP